MDWKKIYQKYWWILLALAVFITYAPFMGERVIRPAGDDKVYVAQAVEMARDGRWFVQTLADQPNYYKGPLHYIFLRVGMMIFGRNMWATVYMHLLLLIFASIALGAIVKRNFSESGGWPLWAGIAFATNAGVFAHSFASQMETELVAFFVIGLFLLDRGKSSKDDFAFWIITGLAGWLKSPLHSVLLGSTAILYWGIRRELVKRLLDPVAWSAVVVGAVCCASGYAPAYFLDRANFMHIYVHRETLDKPINGGPWYEIIYSLFTYSLWPWMLVAFAVYLDGLSRLFRKREHAIFKKDNIRNVLALGFSLILPTVAFFLYHPYRGHNYSLPVIGGVILLITLVWSTASQWMGRFYFIAIIVTIACFFTFPVFVTAVCLHYRPMPEWWPVWVVPAVWAGALISIVGFAVFGLRKNNFRPGLLALSSIGFYWAIGCLMVCIGEMEMLDLHKRMALAHEKGEQFRISYYNLQTHLWSEWGYLNFMTGYEIRGVHSKNQLRAAIEGQDLILVPGERYLIELKNFIANEYPQGKITLEITPWRRWKTRGGEENYGGLSPWAYSWKTKSFGPLQKDFYIVRVLRSA